MSTKNFGEQRLLEAYVVLEEFIKELAAIVQAGVIDSAACFFDYLGFAWLHKSNASV